MTKNVDLIDKAALIVAMAATVTLAAACNTAAEGAKQPVADAPAANAGYLVKVNCGGPAADGLSADQPYVAGSWGYVGGSPSTADAVSGDCGYPTGMKNCRWSGDTFEYTFDVPRGVYNVILYFAEPSFNQAGDRRFNVNINGSTKLIDYDVYTDAGGRNKAVQKVFDGIAVTEGQLVVRFGAIGGTAQRALVQVIEVRQDTKAKPVATPVPDPAERLQTLDGQWQIAKDPKDVGKAGKWYTADGFPLLDSRPIQVPGHIYESWRGAEFFDKGWPLGYNGVAWYSRTFTLAMRKVADLRYFLRFGCCEYSCDVWLNGTLLGSHEGASSPFEFDVTGQLLPGENFVAVRVFSPGSSNLGHGVLSSAGGLMQHVMLHAYPNVRIADVFARPDWKTGNLPLEITLANDSGAKADMALGALLTERKSGKQMGTVTAGVQAPPGQSVQNLLLTVSPPHLWSPEDPFLYTVNVTADWAGKQDMYEVPRVGFRDFRVNEYGYFALNGKRIIPKSTHGAPFDEAVYFRTARDPKNLAPDFAKLKDAGFNMYRPFAHAAFPEQLDQADELGFLIYNEHPATCHAAKLLVGELQALFRRDRNHPSVVIWGLLNERSSEGELAFAADLLPALRKVDDTRLVLLNSGGGAGDARRGSMSNPGSAAWDVRINDCHLYPGYGMLGFSGAPAGFISEGGIGSSYDPIGAKRRMQRLGVANDAVYAELISKMAQRLKDIWTKHGLQDVYPAIEEMIVDSERSAARERALFFNLVRSNPGVSGYSLTSLGDFAGGIGGWGEGVFNSSFELKADHLAVLQAGWAKLRWCLFAYPRNAYADQPFRVKVALANEDQLPPGNYPVRLSIAGPTGEVWHAEATVAIQGGANPPLAYAVFDADVKMAGLVEGKHTLAAVLVGVPNAAASRMEFNVTQKEKHANLSKATITVLGVDQRVRDLLVSQGATLREFAAGQTFDREAILVGAASTNAATWRALYQHIARGAHAILLAPDNRGLALGQKGKRAGGGGWLYHSEIIAKRHAIFNGMPAKLLMPDYYGPLVASGPFVDMTVPDESVAVWLYDSFGAPGAIPDGLIVGTYRHHAGKFTVNAFDLLGNLGNPAADRMLVNMAAHASSDAAAVQPLPANYDAELNSLGLVDAPAK